MSQKDLTTREIKRTIGMQRIRGRCLSNPTRKNFDVTGIHSPTWVVDVDIGADNVLRDVPVKIAGHKARSYARLGSPVWLERDAHGRYQVIAAADRTNEQGVLRVLNEDTGLMAAGGSAGFTFARQPFKFYQGTTPESIYDPAADSAVILWLAPWKRALGKPSRVYPATDTNGAAVFRIEDLSASANVAVQNTAANQPLYRRFQTTGGNSNKRCTIDGDGTNDFMSFRNQIAESVGGQVSFFLMVNKDAASSGDDVILQTQNWRIYSRSTATDNWAFNQGGGIVPSTSALGTNFKLIEIIASAYNSIDLYENGTLLLHSTPAGAGMANASSSLLADPAATLAHNGQIAEILVVNGAVTPTKRQSIEAYFARQMFTAFAKWNNTLDAFPKVLVLDAAGVEVPLP